MSGENETDYLKMLCDAGELSALLAGSADVETCLQRMVEMVARHLHAAVCSVYLYDESTDELVLRATAGLNPDAVGEIRMKTGDGLVGFALQTRQALREDKASLNPHFKYFPVAGEEPFESFLAVPIVRGAERIGVLAVQREADRSFTDNETRAMGAIASQLAGTIESARALMEADAGRAGTGKRSSEGGAMQLLKGEAASGGVAFAPLVVMPDSRDPLRSLADRIEGDVSIEEFRQAVAVTEQQITNTQEKLSEELPEVATLVFTSHLMMLKDSQFAGAMEKRIEAGTHPKDAVLDVTQDFVRRFAGSNHAYMREKADDVRDLARRLLGNLSSEDGEPGVDAAGRIAIAHNLFPGDIVRLWSEGVKGVILTGGGSTAHVSILAQSLRIPMVVTENQRLLSLPDREPVLLDAWTGNVYVNPSKDVITQFDAGVEAREAAAPHRERMKDRTVSRDGVRVRLLVNINLLSQVDLALELKAEGVGLYRSEFPFIIRGSFPSETEQLMTYGSLIRRMQGKEVTLRTLDVGGDKVLAYYDHGNDANPALGLRSIRFSLRHKEVFVQQLRAILRAGAEAEELRIMFPMISSVDEFRRAKDILAECATDLAEEGLAHNPAPKVGMMVELPAAVAVMEALTTEAAFFSIGTNDFIQYMLAVDRGNAKIASYYCAHHPSVLRGLARVVMTASAAGRDVSVCGEMAHQEEYLPFLLGIGVRRLSVAPQFLPRLQEAIEGMSVAEAEQTATLMLEEDTIAGAERHLL